MEKTRLTSVYLEESHLKYLGLLSTQTGLSKSQILRTMIDDDMALNSDFVKTFEKIIFSWFIHPLLE